MARPEMRIIFAAIAILVSLGAVGVAIHSLLFDEYRLTRYSVAVLVCGIACFVTLLNPKAGDDA